MNERNRTARERAIVVGMYSKRSGEAAVEESLQELSLLADTAGADIVGRVLQMRDDPEPATYVGSGKAAEAASLIKDLEATLCIVDDELSPTQIRNLENLMDVRVIDRSQLILDIFALRARTREAKLQIELAQCEYALPRLTGRGIEMSRTAAGIGARGPGETKLEMDRRKLRARMAELRRELRDVERHRELHRSRRKRMGVPVVALVGYTNAGKSSLFNALYRYCHHTEHDVVEAENRLFKTLDTTTRRLALPGGECLLTDTVGFLKRLPHHLVAAFRSTLGEVANADLLVHVVDASGDGLHEHMDAVHDTLESLNASHIPVITALNKTDIAGDGALIPGMMRISARTGQGIGELVERITRLLFHTTRQAVNVPYDQPQRLARLYQLGSVIDVREIETGWTVDVVLSPSAVRELGELRTDDGRMGGAE